MTPELETARLFLRPLALADAEQLQKIFPQWDIVRYLANKVPWPYPADGAYRDVPGLCKVATLTEIEAQGWSLNPGRYVGVTERAADGFDFRERLFWSAAKGGAGEEVRNIGHVGAVLFAPENVDVVILHNPFSNLRLYFSTKRRNWRI